MERITSLQQCDVVTTAHKPNNVQFTYGLDKSGKVKYAFNSLGFRGEEYSERASYKIFLIGACHTVGYGLPYEQAYGYQLKEMIAKYKNVPIDEVNLLNLAMGGASSDYITRMSIRQCCAVKPDLLIAYFSDPWFTEYIKDNKATLIAPDVANEEVPKWEYVRDYAKAYYYWATPELAALNLLKNMVFLQLFCESRGINFISCDQFPNTMKKISILNCNQLTPFVEILNNKIRIEEPLYSMAEDEAMDNWHFGPKTHKRFAQKLLDKCIALGYV